ncbi:hypothetical protein [Streptomyces sp. NPDC004783]|uniref:hypothetical protein n=1 Tax=Streptomyces sp. NPDC004783 TaxID=3154459 RepID=UPI0033BF1256
MTGPLHSTDLDDALDALAELGDDDIDLIITAFRNIAHRASHGHLDINTTQVLLASIAASPDGADLVGACGFLTAEITSRNPALDNLPDNVRKATTRAGEEAAFRLTDTYLREPASEANASLDLPERRCPAVTDNERKELSQKVKEANKQSSNRPR